MSFTLSGLQEKAFYLKPEVYDVLVYPAEWIGNAGVDPALARELSDIFYDRDYGREKIYNLWTMFVRSTFLYWFEDDVALGYRNLLSDALPEEMPNIFPNEAFHLLQSGRLKEVRTDTHVFRVVIDAAYTAIPLVSAALAVSATANLSLGEEYDPVRLKGLLEDLSTFVD